MVVALIIAADTAAEWSGQARAVDSIDDQRTENAIGRSAAVTAKGISLLGSANLAERVRPEHPLVRERAKTCRLPSLWDERGESLDAGRHRIRLRQRRTSGGDDDRLMRGDEQRELPLLPPVARSASIRNVRDGGESVERFCRFARGHKEPKPVPQHKAAERFFERVIDVVARGGLASPGSS